MDRAGQTRGEREVEAIEPAIQTKDNVDQTSLPRSRRKKRRKSLRRQVNQKKRRTMRNLMNRPKATKIPVKLLIKIRKVEEEEAEVREEAGNNSKEDLV